jgi:putative membrane protein
LRGSERLGFTPASLAYGIMLPYRGDLVAEDSNRARDHLANERTFLAWVRTSVAIVVFGFAIGRFAIALRQLARFQGQAAPTTGLSVWMGMISILAGVAIVVAGLARYRKTRALLDEGKFEPAGFMVDLVTILTVLFGLALAGYLVFVAKSLG